MVIRISYYPGNENDLRYANKDAIDMRDALVDVYGFEEGNVVLLLNATYSDIESAVISVKEKAQEGDEVVFFSGHGA
ncbi:MAG: caspase family protein, partial [Archaeoglobaceae archaeon]